MSFTKICAIRGAGFGFLLATFVFVFTWSFLAFGLIAVGMGMGLLVSKVISDERQMPKGPQISPGGQAFSRWTSLLTSPNLAVRSFTLLAIASALFLAAWIVGYYLLPEQVFRASAAEQLAYRGLGGFAGSVSAEGWRLLRNNIIPFALIVLANRVIRVNGIPLGFIPTLYSATLYGLFLGTNSFAILYPQRLAPTFAILTHAGPYELLALMAAAAATATWSVYEVHQIFRMNPECVSSRPKVSWVEVGFLLLALALLAAAAWIEATMILG